MPNVRNKGYEYVFLSGINNTYAFITTQEVVYELKFKPSSYIFGNQPPFTEFTFEFVIEIAENPLAGLPPLDKPYSYHNCYHF